MEARALSRSIILVHFHTPELARDAVAALQVAGGDRDEIILVDNGSTPEGRRLLETLPVRFLDAGGNRGYAGGANLGVAEASSTRLVIMNPDVVVRKGCLDQLDAALDDGAGVAGPRFFWDDNERLLLPPTERRRLRDEVMATFARRGGHWARRARRRWRAHAWRCWRASQPVRTWDLSGALLAIRRDAWQAVGPLDEEFALYFEETDWLARARAAGVEARYVPAATAVHAYGQSSRQEPSAAAWFQASARRYRRKHLGRFATAWLEACHRTLASAEPPWPASSPDRGDRAAAWIEVSTSPTGFPAAAMRLDGTVEPSMPTLPAAVEAALRDVPHSRRLIDEHGRELACLSRLDRSEGG